VGTRYGVIYIGSEGNEGKPSEFQSRSSGTRLGEWMQKAERVPKPKLGNRTQGTGLNTYIQLPPCPKEDFRPILALFTIPVVTTILV
jgi:hypothetical protein